MSKNANHHKEMYIFHLEQIEFHKKKAEQHAQAFIRSAQPMPEASPSIWRAIRQRMWSVFYNIKGDGHERI